MAGESDPQPLLRTRLLARTARTGSGVVLLLVVATVIGAVLLPPLLGYGRYVIDGGSMEPAVPRGSMLYTRTVPVADLKQGDVITYVQPGGRRPVTHRISRIERGKDGRPVFETKGDANERPDARTFSLDSPEQARYSFHVPYLGWPIILLGSPLARILALGLPALLVALFVMRSLWREGGKLLDEAEAKG